MFSVLPTSVAPADDAHAVQAHMAHQVADDAHAVQAHVAHPDVAVAVSHSAPRTVAESPAVPLQDHQQDENDAKAANSTVVEVHEAKHASTSVAVAGHESNPSKRLKIMKKIRDFDWPGMQAKRTPLKDQWEPDEGWQSVNPSTGEAADEPDLELLEATVSNRKPNKNNKQHQKHCK